MKKLSVILVLAVLLVSLVFNGCGETEPAVEKELKIGISLTLSTASTDMVREYAGIKALERWLEKKGGVTIDGETYQVKFVVEDSKSTAEGGLAAVNKLVYDEQLKYVVTFDLPFIALAERDITEKAGVLFARSAITGSPGELGPEYPLTFGTRYLPEAIPNVIDHLCEYYPDVETVALLDPEMPDSIIVDDMLAAEAESRGVSVTCQEFFPADTIDFYSILTKMLATDPDAIGGGCGMASWVTAIVKQARELGFDGPIFWATPVCDPVTLVESLDAEMATDIFYTSAYLQSPDMPATVDEIAAEIEDMYGFSLLTEHIQGWQTAYLMVQVIEKTQSLDPVEIASKIPDIDEIQYPFGMCGFGGLETFGIKAIVCESLPMTSIMNGEIKHLYFFDTDIP